MVLPYQIHQKKLARQTQQPPEITTKSSSDILSILKNKSFWIWDKEDHLKLAEETSEQCCWNHIVGLPQKDRIEFPIFDYEKILYDALFHFDLDFDFEPCGKLPPGSNFKDKHLWVKKSTGLGVTEFMLRIMAWLCTRDDRFKSSQMCIVTGPNIDMAIKLIRRMKGIFERKLGVLFHDKETVLELKGCRIEAYPSNHLDAYRALENPKFILIDEADFFRKSEQEDVRHVSERYIGKSDPYIVMISTPNNPGGLFERIEKEPEMSCIYKRLKLDYNYGLGRIYTKEEIEKARKSPSFEREYNLKYLGKIGNVFSPLQIDRAVELGEELKSLPINQYVQHYIGIDPGFGSSKTGIVLTEYLKEQEKIRVLYAEEFDHPNPQDIVSICHDLHEHYHNSWFFVDGANRGFITELKVMFEEDTEWEPDDVDPEAMHVLPVNFMTEHKAMLSNLHLFINKEYLAIPSGEKFDKLITSLKTAHANEYSLDKEQTSYDDLLDALRLSLRGYKVSANGED